MLPFEGVSNRCRWLPVLLASLLLMAPPPVGAAGQLEVRLDGLVLPIELDQLQAWSRNPRRSRTELGIWLELLDDRSRADLVLLLNSPLLPDRGLALQLLQSWSGRQVLDEVGELLSTDQPGSGALLLSTLRSQLQKPEPFTAIDLLLAVPARRLSLDLDGVLALAASWRQQLEQQTVALRRLRQLPLPAQQGPAAAQRLAALNRSMPQRRLLLKVAHRDQPLELDLWGAAAPRRRAWVLLMPGLGGSSTQLSWLAEGLAQRGWPVLLVEHPGSDEKAVRQLLDGRRPPPGAETLPDRLADVEAVLRAEAVGELPRLGGSVVLMGHSLGGLSALMATGERPVPGLEQRCKRALKGIPLINLSRLLQCQLAQVNLPDPTPPQRQVTPVEAVVSLNGFGSLLWPGRGLDQLKAPLLMVGGSLDLVTPPVSEQLGLFLQQRDPRSRLALVEGGSHFSPVRITDQKEAMLQLGEQLVGEEPLRVQELLLGLSADFLLALETGTALPPQQRRQDGVRAYVLDQAEAQLWSRRLRR
ncbi:alpha/beta hydrolase family protein [Cyanobium sp. ULC082]